VRCVRAIAVATIVFWGMTLSARGEAAEFDMAGAKEAEADLAAGKHSECLHKLAKLLAHTSGLEKSAERGRLLALKGECLLQRKQGPAAIETLEGTLGTEADYFKQEEEDSKTLKTRIEAILKKNKVNG
jgi:hypothetical protein